MDCNGRELGGGQDTGKPIHKQRTWCTPSFLFNDCAFNVHLNCLGISEADVRAQFAEQEKAAAIEGQFHRHDMSPSVFVTWGLSLEDLQYVYLCPRMTYFDS